jgi:hypothetical protein
MTAHGLNGGCRGPNITNERLRAVPPVNLTGVEGPAANDTPRRQGRGSELVLQLKKRPCSADHPAGGARNGGTI